MDRRYQWTADNGHPRLNPKQASFSGDSKVDKRGELASRSHNAPLARASWDACVELRRSLVAQNVSIAGLDKELAYAIAMQAQAAGSSGDKATARRLVDEASRLTLSAPADGPDARSWAAIRETLAAFDKWLTAHAAPLAGGSGAAAR